MSTDRETVLIQALQRLLDRARYERNRHRTQDAFQAGQREVWAEIAVTASALLDSVKAGKGGGGHP